MLDQGKPLNVAIVGGGPGCKAIMDIILAEKLRELPMKLIGVACTNPNAVGYRYAQKRGDYTTQDYRDLYELQDLNMIIELTGRDEVLNEIIRTKPDHVRLMGHVAARLFWDVFRIEEKRILERERAEESLRKSEEEKGAILNGMSEYVVYHDAEHRIVWANVVARQVRGLASEEVVGLRCYDVWHERSKPCPGCPVVKTYETGKPHEAEMTTSDGRVWFVRSYPLRDENSDISGVVEIAMDITERKRAEEAHRESEERYHTVLEASPDPVVAYDMEGECTYINPAFTRVFGWLPDELMGKQLDYVPDENWPETRMMIEKVQAGQSFSGVESRRYTKEGKILDVSISAATHLNRNGIPVGSVHILRDITDHKLAEEALRESTRQMELAYAQSTVYAQQLNEEITQRKQAQEALQKAHDELEQRVEERTAELAKTNEELIEYDHIVAHVLKAPLRAIHYYSDFLREALEGTLNEDQKTYLDNVTRAVRQAAGLVDDVLEFSMVGRRSGPIETIDIGVFLQELISSLDLPSDVEVVMGHEWPSIEAEPALIKEIFLRLIRNAVKFNRSPRKCIEIGWLPAGDEHYELFVRDNGIGIAPRYHEQIFNVFRRLYPEEYEGTGIGLAICKKIVQRHGGLIRVESELGKGSTFYFTISSAS